MNVSREFAIDVIKEARKSLGNLQRLLDKPTTGDGDNEKPCYPDGVPNGLSVSSVNGVPAEQVAAELGVIAGSLAALAASE